jgi:5,10-methylenetetrahydrofolate reductase
MFIEKLGKKFVRTFEIDPPEAVNQDFLEEALRYKGSYDAVNVSDCPLGTVRMNSLVPCILLKESGVEPILQMTTRDRNRVAIQADLLGACAAGISSVLALTGDYRKGSQNFTEFDSIGLINLIKEMESKFEGFQMNVGAAVNPNVSSKAELERYDKKKEAGAMFFQTQPVYDLNILRTFADKISGIEQILISVLPFKDSETANFLREKVPGFRIPKELADSIKEPEDGLQIAEQIIDEAKSLGFGGVHIIPFGADVSSLMKR